MDLHGWPFSATVDGDLSTGNPVQITFATGSPTDDNTAVLRHAVECFVGLAEHGGLCGSSINPNRSTGELAGEEPFRHRGALTWTLTQLQIDPRGIVVLLNMVALLGEDVLAVKVAGRGQDPGYSIKPGDFPAAWPTVPFRLDDDRTMPALEVEVELGAIVPQGLEAEVEEILQAWVDCGSLGGYHDPAEERARSLIVPTDHPAVSLDANVLVAQVEDLGVHEGAYDLLVNVLTKLARTLSISEVRIG